MPTSAYPSSFHIRRLMPTSVPDPPTHAYRDRRRVRVGLSLPRPAGQPGRSGPPRPAESSRMKMLSAFLAVMSAVTLQPVLDQAVRDGYPAAIAYVRQGDREWRYAAGVADKATGRPARPSDRFRIASNTKAFVATVVLQLEGEHRLSLDDRVSRWLPELRSTATIRQLLNHTSGIW